MDDFLNPPQVGLRRRRRAIPDDLPAEPFPAFLDNADAMDTNATQARRVRRLVPEAAVPQQPWPTRRPPSDTFGHHNNNNGNPLASWKVSKVYCAISTVVAILAIVTAPVSTIPKMMMMMDHSSSSSDHNHHYHPSMVSLSSETSSSSSSSFQWSSTVEQVAKAAAVGIAAKRGEQSPDTSDLLQSIQQWWNAQQQHQLNSNNPHQPYPQAAESTAHSSSSHNKNNNEDNTYASTSSPLFWWWRHNRQPKDGHASFSKSKGADKSNVNAANSTVFTRLKDKILSVAESLGTYMTLDPMLLSSSQPTVPTITPTDMIDKILTSTPRLLAIANLLLALTYLMHSAIAAWFLGTSGQSSSSSSAHGLGAPPTMAGGVGGGGGASPNMVDWSSPTRERMGGFLVFKLLLISAVVAPDTLDLLILLTWYSTLSCLRSLDHLAHATTTHLNALGQAPRPGVVQLLLLVLVGNILAAASCVALFHAAGWGMVLLLTCDCALLAADVVSHILKYFTCVLEDIHTTTIQSMEARQIQLHHAIHHENNDNNNTFGGRATMASEDPGMDLDDDDDVNSELERMERLLEQENDDNVEATGAAEPTGNNEVPQPQLPTSREDLLLESRRLDQRMEVLDLAHARRLGIMDSAMFTLELLCHALTVCHFCHIWSLHGVQFSLIDGVLALHLHSAISSACKKIAQRRNIHSIARDLHGLFPNASDQELRKASLAGDVCCICLGTMSTGGHVKKVPCGHLYHTHCLREVVERAQSVQAAKCPLCRSCLLDGTRQGEPRTGRNVPTATAAAVPNVVAPAPQVAVAAENNGPPQAQQQPPLPVNNNGGGGADHALFRFSTEGILPAWIPVPAFSFEVVRRPSGPAPPPVPFFARPPPPPPQQPATTTPLVPILEDNNQGPTPTINGTNVAPAVAVASDNAVLPQQQPQQQQEPAAQQQQQPSFLRRFLILAGAIPMSPEEEARALAHLVDMFPQYERSHLLRELRERGSAEAVAEAILMGVFSSGVPRGGGVAGD